MQQTLSKLTSTPLSRWLAFSAAPHRVFFFAGIVQGVLAMLWWLVDLLGHHAGWIAPIAWAVPAPWVHAGLMIYGFLPFFMFGFLMTAVPNWLKVSVPRRYYLAAVLCMSAGWVLFYAGLATSSSLAAAAIALVLVGWGAGLAGLVRMVVLTPERDIRHPAILFTAVGFGWTGLACLLAALYFDAPLLSAMFRYGGLWFFALPIFLSVTNRMVPFFSSRALGDTGIVRPNWSHATLLAGCAGHGALEIAGLARWTWVVDLPMAAAVVYLAFKWGLLRSFTARLLAVLHLSLMALAFSLSLFVIQSLTLAISGERVLGLAPLHAMTIGYFSSMVIGMVSRVSLGHSGNTLVADRLTWFCFLGILAAAAFRVGADLPGVTPSAGHALTLISALMWLACFCAWGSRYLPKYLAPRIDGRPG